MHWRFSLRKSIFPFTTACFSWVLVGCGGGSGNPGPPVVPQTQMRGNAIGDGWSYDVNTDLPGLGNGSGTLTDILGSDTYNGQPSIRETQTFELKYPQQLVTISAYNEIATSGGLEAVDNSGSLDPVVSDTFAGPSVMGPNTDVKGVLTLESGLTVTTEYKVVGKERVKIPAGTFDCWIVDETQTQSSGTKDNFVLDVAPETGNWVRANAKTVYADGEVFTWQAQMFLQTNAVGAARKATQQGIFFPRPR